MLRLFEEIINTHKNQYIVYEKVIEKQIYYICPARIKKT